MVDAAGGRDELTRLPAASHVFKHTDAVLDLLIPSRPSVSSDVEEVTQQLLRSSIRTMHACVRLMHPLLL